MNSTISWSDPLKLEVRIASLDHRLPLLVIVLPQWARWLTYPVLTPVEPTRADERLPVSPVSVSGAAPPGEGIGGIL